MSIEAALAVDYDGLQAAALGSEGHGALKPQMKLCKRAKWIVLAPELQSRGSFTSYAEWC